MVVKRRGHRPLAILVDEVTLPEDDPIWHPFPVVPTAIHEFFAAITLQGEECRLLIREELFQNRRDPTITARIRDTLIGWIESPCP
ncbi:hypothetical protein CCP3SC1_50067 [Gammaproteobacteria bacterium]